MDTATGTLASRGGVTIVRSIESSVAELGLGSEPEEKRRVLDAAYANPDFRALVRLSRDLISLDTVTGVLERALDMAFETLPVHRGVILLRQQYGLSAYPPDKKTGYFR